MKNAADAHFDQIYGTRAHDYHERVR